MKTRVGGEGVNEGKAERALGESGRASQKMTGRSRETEERERENPADSVPSYSP